MSHLMILEHGEKEMISVFISMIQSGGIEAVDKKCNSNCFMLTVAYVLMGCIIYSDEFSFDITVNHQPILTLKY